MAIIFILGLISGCDNVSKSDISNAIKMCEGHHGLEQVVPSKNAGYVDIYCNSGTQFIGVEKIKETSNCQTIRDNKYCY